MGKRKIDASEAVARMLAGEIVYVGLYNSGPHRAYRIVKARPVENSPWRDVELQEQVGEYWYTSKKGFNTVINGNFAVDDGSLQTLNPSQTMQDRLLMLRAEIDEALEEVSEQ